MDFVEDEIRNKKIGVIFDRKDWIIEDNKDFYAKQLNGDDCEVLTIKSAQISASGESPQRPAMSSTDTSMYRNEIISSIIYNKDISRFY